MSNFSPAKTNVGIGTLVNNDPRLGQVKVFEKAIMTPVAVSENGYIAIYQAGGTRPPKGFFSFKPEVVEETLTVIHASEINSTELLVEGKSGLGGALIGGLIGGDGGAVVGQQISSGKAKSIDLQIKTTNFKTPQIVIPLFRAETFGSVMGGNASYFGAIARAFTNATPKQREEEIQELMSQIDNICIAFNRNQAANTVLQQTSNADELAKYKKLLDDGAISQDEFDAKKKQILGL